MSITQDQINRFFEILAASKLPSELTELLQAPTSSQFIVIQTGSEDAKKVNVSRVRGALGNYNASSNSPFLSNGAATEGDSYFVTNTGTVDFGNGNIYLPANSVVSYLNGQWRKGGISTYAEIVALLGFTPESTANKGVADGYVGLDSNIKINPIYLPAYVDEIIEGTYVNATTFNDSLGAAVTPAAAKIYLDTTSSKVYRWGGTAFAEIVASPGSSDAVPEGVTNLYFKENRVLSSILAGISFITETAVTAADSVLIGFGKLQAQITTLTSSISGKLDRGGYAQTAQTLKDEIEGKANDSIVVKSVTVNGTNSTPNNGLVDLGTITGTFVDAPSDTTPYARKDGAWVQSEPLNVPPIANLKVKVYNLDGSVTYEDYGGGSSGGATPVTKAFTYSGGAQEFTVDTPIIKPDYILVGNTSLQLTQFTWSGSTFTITDTLTVGAVIEIGYWDATAVIGSVSSKSDKTIQITGVSLAASGWALVGSFYEYDYANVGITANKIVDVIPDKSTIDIVQAAEILPETLSGAGTVKFYSKNLPTATILVTINIEE